MNDKVKEIIEQLEEGIKSAMNSTRFKQYLKVQSMFHNYSFNNTMLIMLQKPDATRVMGYESWRKLERQVNRGEKAISIIAPSISKKIIEQEKVDPVTKQPIKGHDGKPMIEKVEIPGLRFVKASVFDISQTSGKELPSICNELQGNSKSAAQIIEGIKAISPIPINEGNTGAAKGYYAPNENIIVYKAGMPLDQVAKTLVHEFTHYKLHNNEAEIKYDRQTAEVQAESVAYVVSNKLGLDTSEYSFDYIAAWSSGKDLKELKKSLEVIQKTSCDIIDNLQKAFEKQLEVSRVEPQKNQVNTTPIEKKELRKEEVTVTINFSEGSKFKENEVFGFKEANTLFEKYDKEVCNLKAEAQAKGEYYPYFKTSFTLNTVIDKKEFTYEGRFDIGDGEGSLLKHMKNILEIRKDDLAINRHLGSPDKVKEEEKGIKLIEEKLIPKLEAALATSVKTVIETQDVKEKIIDEYNNEFPAIKHITKKAAKLIDEVNERNGKHCTITQIKRLCTKLGKQLENGEGNLKDFNKVKAIVDDINKCKVKEQTASKQPVKVKSIEMEI